MPDTTVSEFRFHALTPGTSATRPTMLPVPSRLFSGCHLYGVTRDVAVEDLGSALFEHDVLTISVSAHASGGGRISPVMAEVFLNLEWIFGSTSTLREVTLPHTTAIYFTSLVNGSVLYAPSPMQAAFLSRRFNARELSPLGA